MVIDIPDADRKKAEQIVAQAHQLCPYSTKAIRGNINVRIAVGGLNCSCL
ncbi:hypothetical protein [Scytonema sp. HK-05]|nr:hypothetical protein [Scytonema sp. HK-05]